MIELKLSIYSFFALFISRLIASKVKHNMKILI